MYIDIKDKFSIVELPEGMPKVVFNDLKKIWVGGQKLKISRVHVAEDGQAGRHFETRALAIGRKIWVLAEEVFGGGSSAFCFFLLAAACGGKGRENARLRGGKIPAIISQD